MERKKTSWYLRNILNVMLVSMYVIPLSITSFYEEEDVEELEYNFIYDDISVLSLMTLLSLIWVLYQNATLKWIRIGCKILLLLFGGLIMLYGIGGLILPIQDFYPYAGLYVMLTILPTLLLIFLFEYREKERFKNNPYANILDEGELSRLKE